MRAVAGLLLIVGVAGIALLGWPDRAAAQTLPPEVTYAVTCEPDPVNGGNRIRYLATVRNPNAAGTPGITYNLVRHWSDGQQDNVVGLTNVQPQTSRNSQVLNNTNVDGTWTHTLTVKVGEQVVAGPIQKNNPCDTTTTTTTTTTSRTTTTTTSASSSTTTTAPAGSTTSTTGTGVTTTTPTTTATSPVPQGSVRPASSGGSGGGLAATGAAVVLLVGIGGLLLANGLGAVRMTRPGWGREDEE